MTIAAGMWCSDGILVCADTEVTDGNSKYQRPKVFGISDDLMVTGAGTFSYIKMASDQIAHRFSRSKPHNPQVARAMVENIVWRLHTRHVLPLYQHGYPYAQSMGVWLIVAMRCGNGELALVKTELGAAALVDSYEAVGAGADVFRYWAGYLLDRKLNMQVASYVAMFMVREAKDSVSGVGGSTQVFGMARDLSAPKTWRLLVTDEGLLAGFPNSVMQVIRSAIDLSKPDGAYWADLEIFKTLLRDLRGTLQNHVRMVEHAALPLPEDDKRAMGTSFSNAPEPPPEQSGGGPPLKGAGRGRRRP